MSKVNIEFKLLHELAQAPKYAHDGDAGADLVCIEDVTLEPGDVISTGSPQGVGAAMDPPTFLQPGDVVACTIDRIGTISNPVVAI